MENVNKIKSQFSEKVNKIYEPLVKLNMKKKETQISNIKNEREESNMHLKDTKKDNKGILYYEPFAHKFDRNGPVL